MIDNVPCINVSQRFQRQSSAFFFLGDPRDQCLLHDPATRAFHASGYLIEFFASGNGTCAVSTLVFME